MLIHREINRSLGLRPSAAVAGAVAAGALIRKVNAMPETDSRIDVTVDSEGTVTLRTNDSDPHLAERRARESAELQAALDAFRARGVARPVVFTCCDRGEEAARDWSRMEPTLREAGVSTYSSSPNCSPHYIVTPDVVRELLRRLMGESASGWFPAPEWPLSYWIVSVAAGGLYGGECLTPRDRALRRRRDAGCGDGGPHGRGHCRKGFRECSGCRGPGQTAPRASREAPANVHKTAHTVLCTFAGRVMCRKSAQYLGTSPHRCR